MRVGCSVWWTYNQLQTQANLCNIQSQVGSFLISKLDTEYFPYEQSEGYNLCVLG